MTGRLINIARLSALFAVAAVVVQTLAPSVVDAQPARAARVRGPEDLIRFALENYFHEITLDDNRRRQVSLIVREHFEASERLKSIDEKNAALPKRRARLRALLRTDAERKQFDRNVADRALP